VVQFGGVCMNPIVVTIAVAAYGAVLFLIATRAEHREGSEALDRRWPLIYAMSIAVYFTGWTFYGGVGAAAREGWSYIPIYLGPALVFLFGLPFLTRLAALARRDNAISISDFISSQCGKTRSVAALVALIALLGAVPYQALQLKAIGHSYVELVNFTPGASGAASADATITWLTLAMAVFIIVFGARRFDATGRNRGLVVAVAFESVFKLFALIALAILAAVIFFEAPPEVRARAQAELAQHFEARDLAPSFITMTILSMAAIVCLPRQFYVQFVEGRDPRHMRTARYPFLLYLLVVIAIVPIIALAGFASLPSSFAPDLWVLDLPLMHGDPVMALLVFLGGLAAGTGMMIVAVLALSTMVTNDLIAPLLMRWERLAQSSDVGRVLLNVRRGSIVLILALAYGYYHAIDSQRTLASIGLISFSAVIQFAPALIGAVYWRRHDPQAIRAGLIVGLVLWLYTLMIPSYVAADALVPLTEAFGGLINPQALFGWRGPDPLTHGVLWSLGGNLAAIAMVSHWRRQMTQTNEIATDDPDDAARMIGVQGDLLALVARFVGHDAARFAFQEAAIARGQSRFDPGAPVDQHVARMAERLIAGVIGAPSARLILASALTGAKFDVGRVVGLLDTTSQELQFSRELLSTTLNTISQGVSVVDRDLNLVAWNRCYIEMFEFPEGFVRVGRNIADVIRYNAERGECGPGEIDIHVEKRISHMRRGLPHVYERVRPNGMVLKTIGNPMPGGGYVTTFTDISAEKAAQIALLAANETLEDRVLERTSALAREVEANRRLANQLHGAKQSADEANASKTRFLAAASHDLLQPLHAARLFNAALQSDLKGASGADLAANVDRAIASADRMLRTLLDISKLDAGGIKPQPTMFSIGALLEELSVEFRPLAKERGLRFLTRHDCDCAIFADRMLLRSVLQNFLSNAFRYTSKGGVLLGCRWRVGAVRVEVWDTGPGIADDKLQTIFEEFSRIDQPGQAERGAGLGLAICQRAAKLMGAPIEMKSQLGKGSMFAIEAPRAAGLCETNASHSHPAPSAKPPEALKGLNVLCVDNDSEILAGLEAMLERWGCVTHLAATFEEAVAAAKAEKIDVALVDFHLYGEETGIDVVRALRKGRRRLKAALVTANASPGLYAEAGKLGVGVLKKPVEPSEIRAMLVKSAGD
jgi:Na+/proline symporter/signal transduction histidine kinase